LIKKSFLDLLIGDSIGGHTDLEDLCFSFDVTDLDAAFGRKENFVDAAERVDADVKLLILKRRTEDKNSFSQYNTCAVYAVYKILLYYFSQFHKKLLSFSTNICI
jgi:hypothetical protein